MSKQNGSPELESPRPRRARRRVAGIVAQYIHELSERHAEQATREPDMPPRGQYNPVTAGSMTR